MQQPNGDPERNIRSDEGSDNFFKADRRVACAFSMMSSKGRAGLSEGKSAVPVDFLLESRPSDGFFNDVHLTLQPRSFERLSRSWSRCQK